MRTTDGGITWILINIYTEDEICSILFLNKLVGFVAIYSSKSTNYILKTINGGESWNKVTEFSQSNPPSGWTGREDPEASWDGRLNKINFVSELAGYAAGYGGLLYRTNDGGNSWEYMPYPEYQYTIQDIFVHDPSTVWATAADSKLYKTIDGGSTWTNVLADADGLPFSRLINDLVVVSPKFTVAVGGNDSYPRGPGTIYESINGGGDWKRYDFQDTDFFFSVDFASHQFGLAVGTSGAIYCYTDQQAPKGTLNINGGEAFTNNPSVNLNLAADWDTAWMRFSDDGVNWPVTWEVFQTSFPYTLTAGDGIKTVYAQIRDAADNVSDTFSATITFDTTAPSLFAVSINADAVYTNTLTVSLTLPAQYEGSGFNAGHRPLTLDLSTDDAQNGYMRFGNDGATWSNWIQYAANANYELSAGDGSKTVFVQLKDLAGNTSNVCSDTIILDQTPPGDGTPSVLEKTQACCRECSSSSQGGQSV